MMNKLQFEGRLEFFGSLFWNFYNGDTFAFDKESTEILKDILKNPHYINQLIINKKEFIKKCEKIGLIKKTKPNYYFIINTPNKNKILSAPIRIHYAITSKCNLNCKHCFTRNILDSDKKELTFEKKIDIFNQMNKLGIREMLVSGGEPFIYPKFIDFLREGCKRNINIKVFSNGFLITNKIINQIKNIPIDYLAISIDGATEYSFKKIRGAQDFNKLKKIIKSLSSQCKFPIVMQITVSKINYNDIDNYFKIAIEAGVKRIKIRALKPGGEILNNPSMMISFKDYLKFCKKAEQIFLERNYKKKFGLKLDCTIGNIRLTYHHSNLMLENIPQPYGGFGCVGGKITLFIDSFGYVHPCAFIDNFLDKSQSKNIKNLSIKKIWNNSENICSMRNLKGNSKCFSCYLYNLCRGGCKARSTYHYKTSNLNFPDGWCPAEENLQIKK